MLSVSQSRGWKKSHIKERKTTHPGKIKLIVDGK